MQLNTPRLILRDFRASDFDSLRALEAHPDTYRYEQASPSEETTRMQLEKILAHQKEGHRKYYRLAITLNSDEELIGRLSLVRLNDAIREWEIGWAIHPREWGKAYATEAAWHMLDFAFKELDAHRVTAICHASNTASVRVMEKLTMHRDGHLREIRWWHEGWHDELVYSILDREWKKD